MKTPLFLWRSVISTLALALLAAQAGAGVVGADRVSRILVVKGPRDAAAVLRSELPEAGGRLFLVSPNNYLPGLLLPLGRDGALKELVAALPHADFLSPDPVGDVRAALQRDGVAGSDAAKLAHDNGVVSGKIEDLSLTLAPLSRLPRQGGSFLVALDAAFLTASYRNEVKTPIVEMAWKLVLALRERRVTGETVVLFDGSAQPGFPLEYGFLASLLSDMVAEPGAFADKPPARWKLLGDAELCYFFGQSGAATRLYKEYLGQAPGDASASYKIALMAVKDLDVDMALQWLGRAAGADPRYVQGYADVAAYLFRKEMFDAGERVLLSGRAQFPRETALTAILADYYLARGEEARARGDRNTASGYFDAAASLEGAEQSMREKARELRRSLDGAPGK